MTDPASYLPALPDFVPALANLVTTDKDKSAVIYKALCNTLSDYALAAVQRALAAQQAAQPLPLLVRDLARELGISSVQACEALREECFGVYSQGMAVTPTMARALRRRFEIAPQQAAPAPFPRHHENGRAAPAGQAAAPAVAIVTECEACFTPDVCQLRGTCDHYAAERLRMQAPAAEAVQPPAQSDAFLNQQREGR